MRDMENEEEGRAQRPRVVDKRVSARSSTPEETSPSVDTPVEPPPPPPEASPPPSPPPAAETAPQQETQEPTGPAERVWTPEQEAQAQEMAREIAARPAADWILNSAITLANVAAVKLEAGAFEEAQLAIDALAAISDASGDRLGSAEAPLRQTLAQLQMAYAQSVAGPQVPPQPGG